MDDDTKQADDDDEQPGAVDGYHDGSPHANEADEPGATYTSSAGDIDEAVEEQKMADVEWSDAGRAPLGSDDEHEPRQQEGEEEEDEHGFAGAEDNDEPQWT